MEERDTAAAYDGKSFPIEYPSGKKDIAQPSECERNLHQRRMRLLHHVLGEEREARGTFY